MSAKLLHSVKEMQKLFLQGGIKYCLVGGLAVSARVGERTAKDIDYAVTLFL